MIFFKNEREGSKNQKGAAFFTFFVLSFLSIAYSLYFWAIM